MSKNVKYFHEFLQESSKSIGPAVKSGFVISSLSKGDTISNGLGEWTVVSAGADSFYAKKGRGARLWQKEFNSLDGFKPVKVKALDALKESADRDSATDRDELLGLLKAKFPNVWFKKSEEFSKDRKDSIWTGSEGETFVDDAKKKPAFNPTDSIFYDPSIDKNYEGEVHKTLSEFLKKHGWYAEFNDAATIFLFKI